jgi:tyrosyl-tRNA synthetase
VGATAFEELQWRGSIHDVTPEIAEGRVGKEPLVAYCGFDPTASSLHLGNFIPIIGLMRLQRAGHTPIALVGGATAMIGDPSGKSDERNLLDTATIRANQEAIGGQLERFLDFEGANAAKLVNNADWFEGVSFIDFLRDTGKHFRVNYMLGKESVRSRLDSEQGMSFTEFSYMLLQASDFLHLHTHHGCSLQVGGADQWGNITAGIDLVRRVAQAQVHGLTYPLLTTASGGKFGKTESGSLWLDPERTSPYELYQYFVRTDDRDVVPFLKLFTFLDADAIAELEAAHEERPHAREVHARLAWEVTVLIHGEGEAEKAVRASRVLFGEPIEDLDEAQLLAIFADVPSTEVDRVRLGGDGWSLVEALQETGLCKSNGDARRRIEGGGIYVNNVRAEEVGMRLTVETLASENTVILRGGKKNYRLVRFR